MQLDTQNVHQRDLILFSEPYDEEKYGGGVRRFDSVSYADLQELWRLKVIDMDDQQNYAPNVREVMDFLKAHPNFRAHGYAVSPKRDDYRVSLEGVSCGEGYDLQDVWDFFSVFRNPDDLRVDEDGIYCWFD